MYFFLVSATFLFMATNTYAIREKPIPLIPPGPIFTTPHDDTVDFVVISVGKNADAPRQLLVKTYESVTGKEYTIIIHDVSGFLYEKIMPGMLYKLPRYELPDSNQINLHPDFRGISFYKDGHVKIVMKRFDIHRDLKAMHFLAADTPFLLRGFGEIFDCFEDPEAVCDPELVFESVVGDKILQTELKQNEALDVNSLQYESLILTSIGRVHHNDNPKKVEGMSLDFVATFNDNRERPDHYHQGVFTDGQIIQPFCDYMYVPSNLPDQNYHIERRCSFKGKVVIWKQKLREFVGSIPYRLGFFPTDI